MRLIVYQKGAGSSPVGPAKLFLIWNLESGIWNPFRDWSTKAVRPIVYRKGASSSLVSPANILHGRLAETD